MCDVTATIFRRDGRVQLLTSGVDWYNTAQIVIVQAGLGIKLLSALTLLHVCVTISSSDWSEMSSER